MRETSCITSSVMLALLLMLCCGGIALAEEAVEVSFKGTQTMLRDRDVSPETMLKFQDEVNRNKGILSLVEVTFREEKKPDIQGFDRKTGRALYSMTLVLKNDVILETRSYTASWERIDRTLASRLRNIFKTYHKMRKSHEVKPGTSILNL